MSTTIAAPPATPGSKMAQLWKRVFSFPVALLFLFLPIIPLTERSRLNDPDLWWHLRIGQVIWTTHHIPLKDLFSWTTGNHSSIPHEWLTELSMYAAYHFAGYSGLMVWMLLATCGLMTAAYVLGCLVSGNCKASFLTAFQLWLFATIGLAPRPHLFGYTLLLIELIVFELTATRDARWIWVLPPLFVLWVNSHGSFVLGLLLAVVFCFVSLAEFDVPGLIARKVDSGSRRHIFASVTLACLALLINPVGKAQILYPLGAMLDDAKSLDAIQEFQPLQITEPRAILLALLVCGIAVVVIARGVRLRLQDALFALGGIYLALRHQRMLFVCGILLIPLLSRLVAQLWEGYRPDRDRPGLNLAVMAVSVAVIVLAFPNRAAVARQVEEGNPTGAVAYLKTHRLSTYLLNDYLYGGYLVWAAPEYPDFIDGRGDVFAWAGVLYDYARWATLQEDPRHLLDQYRISTCLLVAGSPMAHVLALLPEWQQVYADKNSVIFTRRPGPPRT